LVEELREHKVPVVVAAEVGDVLPEEPLGFDDFVGQKIRCLLENPLPVVPRVVVAGLPLRTALAQANLDGPIDRLAAYKEIFTFLASFQRCNSL
jgi:hypothetical protein